MSLQMFTRCAHCTAVFRVTLEQLQSRGGQVRCGVCERVFDAFPRLSATDPRTPDELAALGLAAPPVRDPTPADAVPAVAPPRPSLEAAADVFTRDRHPAFEEAAAAEPPSDPPPEVDAPMPSTTFDEAGGTAADASLISTGPSRSDVEAEVQAADAARHDRQGLDPSTDDTPAGDPTDREAPRARGSDADMEAVAPVDLPGVQTPPHVAVDFDVAAESGGSVALRPAPADPAAPVAPDHPTLDRATGFRPGASRLARAGVAALVLLATLQAVWIARGPIAQRAPALRPTLVALAHAFGTEVPMPRLTDLLSIEASALQAIDSRSPTRVRLDATLRNRAGVAQAWPFLELTLTDSRDAVAARRVLSPSDYLTGATPPAAAGLGFAADGEATLRLVLDTAPVQAAGYRLYLFHP